MRDFFKGFPGAFPWGASFAFGRQRFFEAGEIRLAILSLLEEGPKHGYQIMKELGERSGGTYRASAGSVYPTLQQLEDEGMVKAEMQNGRRVYRLTAAGRRELAGDPEGVHRIWERAGKCEDWGRPETIAIFPWLGALIQASVRAALRGHSDRVRKILDKAKDELDML